MKLVLMIILVVLAASSCDSYRGTASNNQAQSTTTPVPSPAPSGNLSAPDKKADILRELIETENRWKEAKFKGDVKTLETIFADEFTNVAQNGKTYNKAEWITVWKRGDPTLKSWEISDARLESMEGDKATITFITTLKYKNSKVARSRDTDTFIKRSGRWQVISSQSSMLQ
ncbi:MAG TPA: nuclear transport factor 2 family protein [Pyrinomonadaceae bacterium]|jgi:hypothetical protein